VTRNTYTTKMRTFILAFLIATASCDPEVGNRVIGGSNANIANHPHQMSHRVNNSHSCGCSLISGVKAVSAAHCGGGTVSSYSLLSGTTDRTSTTCGTCALRTATSFVRHPNYSANGGYPNDIATIRWAANIPTNGNTGYATMATTGDSNFAGQSCVITGWGRTNIGTSGTLPTTLQQGTMTVMTNAACQNVWGNSINANHICVTSTTVSSCNGDSGGPLMCSGRLAGATSWGNATCNPNQPSIYSRISGFRAWIDAN
jgi:secreted trypsin-like serine protease